MARSLWKGAISFGLVFIPVELYPATRASSLDLDLVDRRDFAPVGYKRYNKTTGEEVERENIVKAYEHAPGEYVVLSDEELRQANPEASQTIDILNFVDASAVSPLYFDTPYYLAPARGGAKVYALLHETLKRAGKIGIARIVLRVKQHLAALMCLDEAIVLLTMRYADDIRDLAGLPLSDSAPALSEREIDMALSLVDSMSETWDPAAYKDTYRDDIMALIDKKVQQNQSHVLTKPEEAATPSSSNVVDLVALLKQSLGEHPAPAKKSKPKAKAKTEADAPPAPPARRRARS